MLVAILDFSERTMIQANHLQFSCTSDMALTIYGIIFSGPLMHTNTPSGTVLDSVDYQNAGPKMNFLSIISHASDRCFVTTEYVTK